jgi:hypothetical protein
MDLLDLITKGSQTAAILDDADCLHKAAEQFLGAYAAFDGYDVIAASSIAERVLGAAMMLRPKLSSAGRGPTVIFDVNIASGTLMARAARRLRDAGNSEDLVGIALHSLIDGERCGDELGELAQLVVAHTPDEPSSSQCGNSGNHRVGLTF